MRAGRLDRTIKIQRYTRTGISDAGTPRLVWADVATVRAQVLQASSEEFFRAWGSGTESAVIFRIRFLPGLTTIDRVIHEGIIHDIKELKEIGRRKGIEIRTVSHREAIT